MATNDPAQPQGPEDLPPTLFPRRHRPLREVDAEELERLAGRPQNIRPVPDAWKNATSKARGWANLAQFKGRTPEGRKRSLGNLPRRIRNVTTNANVPAVPGAPEPEIPMAFIEPPGLDTLRGRSIRATLSQEEFNLYRETWMRYMQAHKDDYSQPEDEDDLHRLCMETVIQWRLEMEQMHNGRLNIGTEYNQTIRRMQQARKNLAASRAARTAAKHGGGSRTIVNIAVAAGTVDPTKVLEIKQVRAKQMDAELDDFLDARTDNTPQKALPPGVPAIIDMPTTPAAEPVPVERPGPANQT